MLYVVGGGHNYIFKYVTLRYTYFTLLLKREIYILSKQYESIALKPFLQYYYFCELSQIILQLDIPKQECQALVCT